MEQMIEVLKYASALLAVLAPLAKLVAGRSISRPKLPEERHRLIQSFFAEGGVERHPLLVESSFAAAIGHAKLNAVEIPLLLKQRRPTQFIAAYLLVRDYVGPSDEGDRFVLRSIAAPAWLRRSLLAVGILLYGAFAAGALWLLFYSAPTLAAAGSWGGFATSLVLASAFAAVALYCLVSGSRLHWAKQLEADQK